MTQRALRMTEPGARRTGAFGTIVAVTAIINPAPADGPAVLAEATV